MANFSADLLRNEPVKMTEIERNVNEIVEALIGEIKEAHSAGSEYIDSTMTNVFHISHMKDHEAQVAIQARIVRYFCEQKFRVFIEDNENFTRIVIAWFTKDDIERYKRDKAILDLCKIPFDKRSKK